MKQRDELYQYELDAFERYVGSKEYKEKLIKRLRIQESVSNSKTAQLAAYALCKKDPIFFIENFCWTFDPRPYRQPNHLPFFLYDYQIDAVKWFQQHIDTGRDGLVEKSRDMGVTWIALTTIEWYWLFGDAFSGHLGSRKQELVDNRTMDSLFGIVDYQIRNLPRWMLPNKFDFDKHRLYMKLTNPETGNLITGESMNPDFGRQSRKNVALFDEAAFWDYGQEAWESYGYEPIGTLSHSG